MTATASGFTSWSQEEAVVARAPERIRLLAQDEVGAVHEGPVDVDAILWNDQRTQNQCDEIHRLIGREKFIQITGNIALTGFTAPQILWVKENEPEIFAKAKHVLLPKDCVRLKLTGEYAMDKADGAGTVLFDLRARDWSDEVLSALEIPRAWMPKTFEGTEFTGYITEETAAVTGLKVGTPVAAGGGDQAAGAVGVGAVEPGILGLTVGTSGVVFATTPSALIEPHGRPGISRCVGDSVCFVHNPLHRSNLSKSRR